METTCGRFGEIRRFKASHSLLYRVLHEGTRVFRRVGYTLILNTRDPFPEKTGHTAHPIDDIFATESFTEDDTMLVLTRRVGQEIVIGDDIVLKITGLQGGRVKIGVEAPRERRITRPEVGESTPSEAVSSHQNATPAATALS